jgi:hypothetical protein
VSAVQCPLCGLRFGLQGELDFHAREDHVKRPLVRRFAELRVPHRDADHKREHVFVVQLPW